MVLYCHVISQEPVIKQLCGFMDGKPLWQVTILSILVAMDIVET